MKGSTIIIIVLVIVLVGAIFFLQYTDGRDIEGDKQRTINNLYSKWSDISSRNNLPAINEQRTKQELNKLPQEDLDWLSGFTEQINSAKSFSDYVALAQQYQQFKTTIAKTNLFVELQSLINKLDSLIGKLF